MKKYIASVRDKETRELMIIEGVYSTKKAFQSDLRGNGYAIRFISTEDTFDEDCQKYHERVQRTAACNKAVREMDKKHAQNMGMSVKEYKFWLKTGIYPDGYFDRTEKKVREVENVDNNSETTATYTNVEREKVVVNKLTVSFYGYVPHTISIVADDGLIYEAELKQQWLNSDMAEYRADRRVCAKDMNLFRVLCPYGKEPYVVIFDYETKKYIELPYIKVDLE